MNQKINHEIYSTLGERWYTAKDDPVGLLRAISKILTPWISKSLEQITSRSETKPKILDIGCGGGLFSNRIVKEGYVVTGIDQSAEALVVAKQHDDLKKVTYLQGDAESLPFEDQSFDCVVMLDFLEHVDNPALVIQEASRVLKKDGFFFFHTFNRNFLAWLIAIKGVEWLVKNTPKNLHVIELFIKPKEIKNYCTQADLTIKEFLGLNPNLFSKAGLKLLTSGEIDESFEFRFSKSTLISYVGYATKNH